MRSYLTQCIGQTRDEPELTVNPAVQLEKDDVLLLCSDGLWEPLDDAQLGVVLAEGQLQNSLDELAERAEKASYPHSDNVSAIAVRVTQLRDVKAKRDATAADKNTTAGPAVSPDSSLDRAIGEIENALDVYGKEMK